MESRSEAAIIFALSGLLILVSLFSLNFSVPSSAGPYQTIDTKRPIAIEPNQSLEFDTTINTYLNTYEVNTFNSNNTCIFHRNPPYPTLTSWDTVRLWFGLEQINQTNDVLSVLFYPYSLNESLRMLDGYRTYNFQGYVELFNAETSQGGTCRFTIYNVNSTEISPVLHVHLEWVTYEKPYFYIGIAGLVIALLSPVMALKMNRKLLGLILLAIGVAFVVSGTILFLTQPLPRLDVPVFCCVYLSHPIYCLSYLQGILFDIGWLLVIIGSAMMLFYRKMKTISTGEKGQGMEIPEGFKK